MQMCNWHFADALKLILSRKDLNEGKRYPLIRTLPLLWPSLLVSQLSAHVYKLVSVLLISPPNQHFIPILFWWGRSHRIQQIPRKLWFGREISSLAQFTGHGQGGQQPGSQSESQSTNGQHNPMSMDIQGTLRCAAAIRVALCWFISNPPCVPFLHISTSEIMAKESIVREQVRIERQPGDVVFRHSMTWPLCSKEWSMVMLLLFFAGELSHRFSSGDY